ncbi:helix-turn-helix transcriptional regulator [Rhodococcus sp. 3-2]|uniref:helix-turn-helix transcriptional regulator n=1 Tax=Rhodococcus sp. 3-2 TaxID=2890836 RepID=UPI001D18DA32|nr:hypothetical protein [Rhodococcus sp. 3-2]MCC4306275.1 hypothetical protein [Rhodococcus sp. 3-2]
MRTRGTNPTLDVAVISSPSLLCDAIVALVRSLGYRVAKADPAVLTISAEILLFVSMDDLIRSRADGLHGVKVVAVMPDAEFDRGVEVDGFLDLLSGREQLDKLLQTLLKRPATEGAALSLSERKIVAGYALGLTKPQLARDLFVAQGTVGTHLQRARGKYRDSGRVAGTKVELLMRAIEDGIICCPCLNRPEVR